MDDTSALRRYVLGTGSALALLAFVFVYPRFIIARLGPANPWTSYLYQYGFGLIFFSVGIVLILKTGACRPGRGRDRFWLGVLLAGFVLFAGVHALWIVLAQRVPYLGGM